MVWGTPIYSIYKGLFWLKFVLTCKIFIVDFWPYLQGLFYYTKHFYLTLCDLFDHIITIVAKHLTIITIYRLSGFGLRYDNRE